jgi:hypothetical protein
MAGGNHETRASFWTGASVAAAPVHNLSFALSAVSVDVGAAAAQFTATFRLKSVDSISSGELWMRRGDEDHLALKRQSTNLFDGRGAVKC